MDMTEKEMTEEEIQKKEEEKAVSWLMGQKHAKRQFNKGAFIANERGHQTKIETEEAEDLLEETKKIVRRARSEFKKTQKESK